MPTSREIRTRIRSVENIGQITRALEAVSASRVRKAQARVLASRAYAEKAWEILLNIQASSSSGESLHPLLAEREAVNAVMIVLLTSDRGLAGAFNANIIRVTQRFALRLDKPIKFVTVGRQGRDAMLRARQSVIADFSGLTSDPTVSDVAPIARLAMDEFLNGGVDSVFIAYTDFINTLTQHPVVLSWLPLVPHAPDDQVAAEYIKDVPPVTAEGLKYEYEPSAQAILEEIVPRFTELLLYQAVLESEASEHSARMVAMRNASDNAIQLVDSLTLVYNKARQAAITSEILDIVGGAEALQGAIDKVAKKLEADFETVRPDLPVKKGLEKPDDLTKIEGIGPKMQSALQAAGIDTYEKLAKASDDQLKAAVESAGMRLAPSLSTWADQAAYAARGDWDGLDALQEKLVGGRRVDS